MEYRVTAANRARAHANLVHEPEFARSVGFRDGLVPGVDVFAYMAHPVCEAWGLGWLAGGALEARFTRPVYDGDALAVRCSQLPDGLALEVVNPAGEICASGTAQRLSGVSAPDPSEWAESSLPDPPPEATRGAFEARPVLGSLTATLDEQAARAQLEEVKEGLPAFVESQVVHPGHLLRLADAIISANVRLPPWMHVSSRARMFAAARWGDQLSVRARVTSLFEKRGHRFVQLDVLVARGSQPLMRVDPYTAIYRPAFVA